MSWILDFLYLCVISLLSPWLLYRSWKTGRYRQDLSAKLFGKVPNIPACQSRRIWFHGVSVGEIHLLTTLIAAFRKRHPDWTVIVSATTDTGLAEARARFSKDHVVAWPFDFSWAVNAALDVLQPDVVVLAESELWPNFLTASCQRRIPIVVVNARLSPRSFSRLRQVRYVARRWLFSKVTRIGVQAPEYLERYRALGVAESQLYLTGSVKYDGAIGDRDTPKARELEAWVRKIRGAEESTVIWVAGSTHAPEEAIVIDAYLSIATLYPNLLLILVPRHPDRFEEVAQLLESRGMAFVRRSQPSTILAAKVLLLDTVGELGAAWSLADFGYVGGSLDGRRGGQSMIEPAGYGVPTVFGPHVWNFRDAAQRLVESKAAFSIRSSGELLAILHRWLQNPSLRMQMGRAAQQLVREQQGATARTLDLVDSVIQAPRPIPKAA